MRYRFLVTTTAAFIAVILTAGAWIGIAGRYAPGQPGLVVSVLGGAFSVAFLWLLIARLRALLARPERRLIEGGVLVLNMAILILTFAWIHHQIGLMDLSGPAPRATRDFGDALYFSIVTSTTLGYGDFIPIGPGRTIAAMQALMGYIILGILVSTGFQILAPNTSPGRESGEERSEEDGPGAREDG